MSVLSAEELSQILDKHKDLVFGYIRRSQILLPAHAQNSYFILSDLIHHLVLTFYCIRGLQFDRYHHGEHVKFIDDKTIEISKKDVCNTCAVDCIVDREKCGNGTFEWTFIINKYSGNSHFGIMDSNHAANNDWNTHLKHDFDKIYSFGLAGGYTKIYKYKSLNESDSMNINAEAVDGDRWTFVADLEKKEITVFHNDHNLGVMWKNVFDSFIPIIGNYKRTCKYSIE